MTAWNPIVDYLNLYIVNILETTVKWQYINSRGYKQTISLSTPLIIQVNVEEGQASFFFTTINNQIFKVIGDYTPAPRSQPLISQMMQ